MDAISVTSRSRKFLANIRTNRFTLRQSEADYGAAVSPYFDETSQAGAGTRTRAHTRARTKWGNILRSARLSTQLSRVHRGAPRHTKSRRYLIIVGYLPVFSLSVFPRNAVVVGGTGGA